MEGRFEVTEIRDRHGRRDRSRYRARLFGQPKVGYSLVLFREAGDKRIVTSAVQRMFGGAAGATYIQTQNTLYVLDPAEAAYAPATCPTGESRAG
ncbi:MAG: hypothetical protein AAGA54_23850 [Myxococcota bacterium]